MADKDLDAYLANLGINTAEREVFSAPEVATEPVVEEGRLALVVTGSAIERCETFLVNLLLHIDPAYAVEVEAVEGDIQASIYGGDPGKIIGRGGRTLAALEYLTNAVVNLEGEYRGRITVDVGGYKARRDERLRKIARQAAARARKTGFAVELDPMSAAERRIIHVTLADDPHVISESDGEGRSRRVVVKPA
ncbi:MAG: KH domain-containing protein [Truepera sp.]|nr:KH domain-containing protein [Truepera sp.]